MAKRVNRRGWILFRIDHWSLVIASVVTPHSALRIPHWSLIIGHWSLFIAFLLSGCAKPPTLRPTPTQEIRRGVTWVRVKILDGIEELTFTSGEPFLIQIGGQKIHSQPEKEWMVNMNSRNVRVWSNEGTTLKNPRLPIAVVPRTNEGIVTLNGKPFRGSFEIRGERDGTLFVVNLLDLEDYLRGVVPLEIGHLTPTQFEAVKAQAVASRSYALNHLNNHSGNSYDLESTVRHQVYGGQLAETPLSDLAVLETHGIVATYNGKPIDARYSSTCGGRTTSPEFVWSGGSFPYLKGKLDGTNRLKNAFCKNSPTFQWTRHWKKSDFLKKIERNLPPIIGMSDAGEVTDVKATRWDPSGRVIALEVKTSKGTFTIEKGDIRNLLKNSNGTIFRSNLFEIFMDGEDVTIKGRGMGHGVGMCQWGAIGMAERGYSFRQILHHYYEGISLKKINRFRKIVTSPSKRGKTLSKEYGGS